MHNSVLQGHNSQSNSKAFSIPPCACNGLKGRRVSPGDLVRGNCDRQCRLIATLWHVLAASSMVFLPVMHG